MEKESLGMVIRSQTGSALTIVLIAMLILLPLTLILTGMILKWQRQSAEFRDGLAMEYTARAGLAEAFNRISARSFSLESGKSTGFETEDAGDFVARVRIERKPDVVLSLDGRLLQEPEASDVDLSQTAIDPDLRRVRLYRELEVYLVEARVSSKPGWIGARARAILLHPDTGPLRQVGLRIEQGYFDEDNESEAQRR
jgi:hypothetical protein